MRPVLRFWFSDEGCKVIGAIALGVTVFVLATLNPVFAQQSPPSSVSPAAADSKGSTAPVSITGPLGFSSGDYVVSPDDLLDVYIMDVPEVSRAYRVSSDGMLALPLLPQPIQAAGLTLNQLSHFIAGKFHDSGMLTNAQVTVSVLETRLHSVLVSGEVRNPQVYPVFGPTRLLEILIKAGGLTDNAGNDAVIMRGDTGARADLAEEVQANVPNDKMRGQSFTLNIRKLVEMGDDTSNILLYPGDRVTVPRAQLFYVLGAVNRPGGYVLDEARQHVTVLKALALAGDVNNIAKRKHITILRHEPGTPDEKREEIPVDIKAMVKGDKPDVRMIADDILFVPESTRLKAWHASVNSAESVVTTGGAALMIYH